MEKKEFFKGMGYLGVAVGKEYTQEECEVFYDFLKKYDYRVFIKAIKNRIKFSSYPPKINDLIDECNSCQQEMQFKTIDYMNSRGYFKTIREYDKTMLFVKRGIVPKWLHDDIVYYYLQMELNSSKQQSTKELT